MNDEDKLKDFMTSIDKLRRKKKLMNTEDSNEDPSKFIKRNLELANVWD